METLKLGRMYDPFSKNGMAEIFLVIIFMALSQVAISSFDKENSFFEILSSLPVSHWQCVLPKMISFLVFILPSYLIITITAVVKSGAYYTIIAVFPVLLLMFNLSVYCFQYAKSIFQIPPNILGLLMSAITVAPFFFLSVYQALFISLLVNLIVFSFLYMYIRKDERLKAK